MSWLPAGISIPVWTLLPNSSYEYLTAKYEGEMVTLSWISPWIPYEKKKAGPKQSTIICITKRLAVAWQAAASSPFACVFGHLSSGAAGRSSVRSADSWVMSLLWAVALRSRKSVRWSRRWTSRRSWLRAEACPGGRSPPLRDRETNGKIKPRVPLRTFFSFFFPSSAADPSVFSVAKDVGVRGFTVLLMRAESGFGACGDVPDLLHYFTRHNAPPPLNQLGLITQRKVP